VGSYHYGDDRFKQSIRAASGRVGGAALEDLLRNGALRWMGMEGNNVQVWRTAD
jgi:hypothetical protein